LASAGAVPSLQLDLGMRRALMKVLKASWAVLAVILFLTGVIG
jgi:hypothetical protein